MKHVVFFFLLIFSSVALFAQNPTENTNQSTVKVRIDSVNRSYAIRDTLDRCYSIFGDFAHGQVGLYESRFDTVSVYLDSFQYFHLRTTEISTFHMFGTSYGDPIPVERLFFHSNKFSNDFHFVGISSARLEISGNQFRSRAYFGSSTFTSSRFPANHFENNVIFRNVNFEDRVIFENSAFRKNLTFVKCNFTGEPYFGRCLAPDTLFLMEVDFSQLTQDVDLGRFESKKSRNGELLKTIVVLDHTNIDKVTMDYSKFKLGFLHDVSYQQKVSVFQQVVKNCRDSGLEDSAVGFDKDLQQLTIIEKFGPMAPFFIWWQDHWSGFGYERVKIFQNTLIHFFILYVLVIAVFPGIVRAYSPVDYRGLNVKSTFTSNQFRHWVARLKVGLIYTALLFFGWKMNHAEVRFHDNFWLSLLVYLIYIVGLIHLAYLAAFILGR